MIQFVIILGNSNPEILNARLNKGISEFHRIKNFEDQEDVYGINNFIILSGGGKGIKVNDRFYSTEAEYMYEYVSKYINPKYIILEDISKDTIENLINSYKIISQKYPIHEYGSKINVSVCTSSFHLKRTIVLATLLNKQAYNLKFIHTFEKFTDEVNQRELRHLNNFLNNYCDNLSNL